MSKRANPMAVKAALTYEIGEAAMVLGKTPATIRNWIKDGLPVMSSRKPYLICGEAIRKYLRAKYQANKTPLAPDELFCLSCRAGRRPRDMGVEITAISPKISLLKGACQQCGACSTRMIAQGKIPEFSQTFEVKESGHREAY